MINSIAMPFKNPFRALRAPLLFLLGALLPLAAPAQTAADARGLPTLAPLVNGSRPKLQFWATTARRIG